MQHSIRFIAVALACAITSPLVAQEQVRNASAIAEGPMAAAPAPASTSSAAPSLAPTVEHAAVGVRSTAGAADPATAPRRAQTSRNVALMIVGGAALIVGAVIGDTPGTIIMIGGGVAGLIGLYQYLQ